MTRVVVVDLDDRDALRELADLLRPFLAAEQPAVGALVSTTVAAEARGLHPKTVEKRCREGLVPGAVKVGRSWRLPVESLDGVGSAASPSPRPVSRPGNAKPRRRPQSRLESPYNQSDPGGVGAPRGPGRTPEVPTMKHPSCGPAAPVVPIENGRATR